jgi:hypothetical protein
VQPTTLRMLEQILHTVAVAVLLCPQKDVSQEDRKILLLSNQMGKGNEQARGSKGLYVITEFPNITAPQSLPSCLCIPLWVSQAGNMAHV